MTTSAKLPATVGFIGLGIMGKPMALNLQRAGVDMIIYNRSPAVMDEVAPHGLRPATSPKDLAERAEAVIVMVADTPAVDQVLLGANGVLQAQRAGGLIIDMGTTAVPRTREFAAAAAAQACDYVDAPVSGGQVGAREATLSIMAGGSESAFSRALPIFQVLGKQITHVGGVGAGQVAKAANQVIVGLTIGAVAEALSLARHCGVDPAKVREAVKGGFAWSRIMELHGLRMIEGEFAPGAKAVTQRKDLQQALDLAATVGARLPATALNRDLYDELIAAGHGDLDHSALIKVLEGDG